MSIAEQAGDETETITGPLALHLWGILCAHEGRYYEAEDALLRAVEAEPEMVGSYMELGMHHARAGRRGRAGT